MKEYAYVFSCGGRVQWSKETEDSLPNRADNEDDRDLIQDFITSHFSGSVGSFITLSTGEMIFRTT